MSTRSSVRVSPPMWLAAAAILQSLVTRRCTPNRRSKAAGAAIAAGSTALAVASVRELRAHGTTVSPERPDQSRTLVRSGPFAYTRNPVYLALAGMLVARAVRNRSMTALVPAAGFIAVLDRVQVPIEEAALRRRFGGRYARYTRAVPRWVGRPSR